jgi:hypothetical protein
MRSLPSVLLRAVSLLVAGCGSSESKGDACPYFIPGPCEGPEHVILVTFKRGTTDDQVAEVNRSVEGTVVYKASGSEDIHVPGDECTALDILNHDPHVVTAGAETSLFPTLVDAGEAGDACSTSSANDHDASSHPD